MEIVQRMKATTNYSTRGWNREEATRYVVDVGGKIVEASHFRHFLDDTYVKDVVELPTSYGCAVGCHHCAATELGTHEALAHTEVHDIAKFVTEDQSLPRSSRFLFTYSGIGEASLMRATVERSAKAISIDFPQCYFNLTTVGLRPDLFAHMESLAEEVELKYVQVSLLHANSSKVHSIMRMGKPAGYRVEDIASAMLTTTNLTFRLNYVVIRDFNSSDETFVAALKLFEGLAGKCVVRVSRMNETAASVRNKLATPDIATVERLAGVARRMGFDAYHFYSLANDNLNCGQLAGDYSTAKRRVRVPRSGS
ncbi:radical SAM protein [Saccharothrix sp.]|uniref:radical SAM protein n=1 Tax=Saccharothrix sp. TaxID=1873460 RepID=UPI002810E2F5|nr:radical SAM protein [Saccharothrix sp.]